MKSSGDILIYLVNLDYHYNADTDWVEPKNSIFIRVKLPEEYSVKQVEVYSPDFNIEKVLVNYTVKDGYLEFIVPSLNLWDIVRIVYKNPEVTEIYPANHTCTSRSKVEFKALIEDAAEEVTLIVDNKAYAMKRNYTSGFYVETVKLSEGVHKWNILIKNKFGEWRTPISTIIIDMRPPRLEIIYPANNSEVGRTFNVKIKAVDELSGLKLVTLYLDEKLAYNESLPGEFVFQNISIGHHVIKAIAMDKAGNSAIASIIIEVKHPETNKNVTGLTIFILATIILVTTLIVIYKIILRALSLETRNHPSLKRED